MPGRQRLPLWWQSGVAKVTHRSRVRHLVGAERPWRRQPSPSLPSPAPREAGTPGRWPREASRSLQRRRCGRVGRWTCAGEAHRHSLLRPLTLDSRAFSINSVVHGSLEGWGQGVCTSGSVEHPRRSGAGVPVGALCTE